MTERWMRWRHGEPIVVVSGLPRSGTSMLMRMLVAGGVPAVTDAKREADVDNPHGYFEDERVKELAGSDPAWIERARGCAIKVISHLVRQLPEEHRYQVLLMHRDLDEVLASQNKMLERRGESNPIDDAKAREVYERHLLSTRLWLESQPRIQLLELRYHEVVRDPGASAQRIADFLGRPLDRDAMTRAVDPTLYRNRGGPAEANGAS